MDKELYLVYEQGEDTCTPIKLLKDQADAIDWFIQRFAYDYAIELASKFECEEVEQI